MRARLSDIQNSRIPLVLGICRDDYVRLAAYVNEASQRLINNATEGWWGGFHRVVFAVERSNPYITLPPQYQSILSLGACRPMPLRNQFYEFLEEGTGALPNPNNTAQCGDSWCLPQQAFDRASVAVTRDLTPTNQYLRVYITDPRDVGFKLLVSGAKDANGVGIYSTDVNQPVNGFLMTMTQPFTTSESIVTSFESIGKSVTSGDVLLKQVDATTGVEVLLARYTPNETNPSYRRYYLRSLPQNCCDSATPGTALVTAMVKVQFAPVSVPTDYLIIGNIPALKEECEALRFSEMDSAEAQQKSVFKHGQAIRLLNQEMVAENGQGFAVNFAPFARASLERSRIGSLM